MEAPRGDSRGNLPTNEFATFPPFTDSREAKQYVPINYSDFSVLSQTTAIIIHFDYEARENFMDRRINCLLL